MKSSVWLPVSLVLLILLWAWLERSPQQRGGAVVLRWVVNSQERDQQFAQAAKKAFEARNPGIRIEFVKTNEGRKVDTMIAGGDAPDILSVGMERAPYYAAAGALRDLNDLMTDADREALKAAFPVTVQAFRQGKVQYALPWGYVPFVLFYNKNLFDRFGIPYPSDDWTWDDYRKAAQSLTRDLDGDGITDLFGASFAQWQEGYYCWVYQNGGAVIEGGEPSFDAPKVVQAVQFLHAMTREDRTLPTDVNRPKTTGVSLFESGRLAMNGPTGSFYIPTYRTYDKIDWDIASVPRGPGGRGTMVAPIGFGVSAQSKHPREAFLLVKFLCSVQGQRILADSGLFVPCRREVALSREFLNSPGLPQNKYALVAMMDDRDGRQPWGLLPPWMGESWGDVNEILNEKLGSFLFGIPKPGLTAQTVCDSIQAEAVRIVQEDRRKRQGAPTPWTTLVGLCVLIAVPTLATLAVLSVKRRQRDQAWGLVAISPWLIGFLVFGAGPILFSLALSFMRWNSLAPADAAQWIGAENYQRLLAGQDELFGKSLRATFYYAALSVPLHLVVGLALALLMNAKVRGIRAFRTIYYLPAVVPAVASAVLFAWIFRQQGILNYVLGGFGAVPFVQMPDWLSDPGWAVPAMVLMGLWGAGGGMMIYLAGLKNIPTHLYEAAEMDGAGVWSRFRAVTLPMLSPVLFFNLVMGIIGALQAFTTPFVLFGGSAGPDNAALLYSFYLYRKAFEQFQVGYGSALAWLMFLMILVLTALVFRSSALWVYYEGKR
ncbi:MAG: extracellular solute-binding protein [Armatimonadetes bacterium]|nr:extracellular solute-binding protein [Armatimonadota bacterium]